MVSNRQHWISFTSKHAIFANENGGKTHRTYPSESHRVSGHSHMPPKSGFDMSEAMNSSCFNPVLPSHSGVEPASGATRSGGEAVDDNCVVKEVDAGTGLKASPLDTIKAATAIENFMVGSVRLIYS